MDSEVSVLLDCAKWRGLLQSQVHVQLSERFNRLTDPAVENQIDQIWTERLSKEPWLFNGAKFRLHSFCFASPKHSLDLSKNQGNKLSQEGLENGEVCENQAENEFVIQPQSSSSSDFTAGCSLQFEPFLTLNLGLTCYKDYLGTNWSRGVKELLRRGETEFSNPLALLAQPLGVGAVTCTHDGQVVLIRRSQKVAEAGGLLDIPGGHPEPKVVCERLGEMVNEEHISLAMMQQWPDTVVSELFLSVCAEIRDEVNIPLSCLGPPVLMGVALNHTSAGRPSAEFFVRCSLTSDEVRKLYWEGGAEANESTDIIFISRTDVLELNRSSPLWSEFCPSAKGAVMLYQTVQPDGEPTSS